MRCAFIFFGLLALMLQYAQTETMKLDEGSHASDRFTAGGGGNIPHSQGIEDNIASAGTDRFTAGGGGNIPHSQVIEDNIASAGTDRFTAGGGGNIPSVL